MFVAEGAFPPRLPACATRTFIDPAKTVQNSIFRVLAGAFLYGIFLIILQMVPLDGYPWLVLKAFTDLFIVACIGWLLIPALLQLLLRGLDTPAMLQILGAGVIWVLPLVFNIGVLYWHA